MRQLDSGYSVEIDLVDKVSWHYMLSQFEDASFYQTWSFGAVHSGENRLSHLVLKKDGLVIGIAQVRIVRAPGLPIGFAYLSHGPVCQPKGGTSIPQSQRNLIRALYDEYVLRRKLFLRIVPQLVDKKDTDAIKSIYDEEGFSRTECPGHNVMIDLSPSLEEIRLNMHHKWRQTLRAAEKRNLVIAEGSSNEQCELALKIIGEMKNRKGFFGGNQCEVIKAHMDLPEKLKLKLLVCLEDNEPLATLGWVTYGAVGLPLVGATGDKGLKLKASYVLYWRMIEYYKTHGFSSIDLGAINEKRNPGGYYFKTHIQNKPLEEQSRYIGNFDACINPISTAFFRTIYRLKEIYSDIRSTN